ncbi:MAG: hypothetical protein B7X28_09575 [Halothiobacillus sp. 13-55-253]|nr:MAG: hypothetical protein B7X28_09575 [Halothiobacillus sp. 13-55-253]
MHRDFYAAHRIDMPELFDADIPYAAIIEQMGEDQTPVVFSHARHPAAQAFFKLWKQIDHVLAKF